MTTFNFCIFEISITSKHNQHTIACLKLHTYNVLMDSGSYDDQIVITLNSPTRRFSMYSKSIK